MYVDNLTTNSTRLDTRTHPELISLSHETFIVAEITATSLLLVVVLYARVATSVPVVVSYLCCSESYFRELLEVCDAPDHPLCVT
jgi:hypothetical protein